MRYWIWIATLFLAACGGEFAYKRGAGPDQLAQDRQHCTTQKAQRPDLCMEEKGWTIHKMDDYNPLMVIVTNPDNRSTPSGPAYVPNATVIPAKDANGKPIPPDPLQKFTVSSWWKAGAGADALQASMDTCVKKLGAAHKPESPTRVTRGLILCLRDEGWYGLQGY